MNQETYVLIEKILIFLQENDSVRLKKILISTKERAESFYPLIQKFEKRTLSQKLAEIAMNSTFVSYPFGLLGEKLEKEEEKKKILEQRLLFCLELKNTLKNASLSSEEKRFLNIIYCILY